MEYCNDNEPDNIAFISNNHKDFANKDKNSIHADLAQDIQNLSYYNSISSFLENEEDNLRDYFIDNFEYDEELLIDELKQFCERNDFLQYTIDDMLMNSEFEGEYFSGWGTDGNVIKLVLQKFTNRISLEIER